MKRLEELGKILENVCGTYDEDCSKCSYKKECEELVKLQEQAEAENNGGFEAGQYYQNENSNIFIKRVCAGMVAFIEGCSPSAIHDIREIPHGV